MSNSDITILAEQLSAPELLDSLPKLRSKSRKAVSDVLLAKKQHASSVVKALEDDVFQHSKNSKSPYYSVINDSVFEHYLNTRLQHVVHSEEYHLVKSFNFLPQGYISRISQAIDFVTDSNPKLLGSLVDIIDKTLLSYTEFFEGSYERKKTTLQRSGKRVSSRNRLASSAQKLRNQITEEPNSFDWERFNNEFLDYVNIILSNDALKNHPQIKAFLVEARDSLLENNRDPIQPEIKLRAETILSNDLEHDVRATQQQNILEKITEVEPHKITVKEFIEIFNTASQFSIMHEHEQNPLKSRHIGQKFGIFAEDAISELAMDFAEAKTLPEDNEELQLLCDTIKDNDDLTTQFITTYTKINADRMAISKIVKALTPTSP